ncbi:gustatory and pheromone receptor 32a-like [Zeugodacus cucurbitae]|uniref:gustatory and pheromone receptor 32a-like n=1 Tax=Zeugodacus cucurbitae TaxID=28588 RepID=UPI0005968A2F|nr:gustatory and pheromone receptor 32a-like [Zeugodacus cucurbitae]
MSGARQHSSIKIGKHCGSPQQRLTTAYSTFVDIKWIAYTLTIIGLLPFYAIINDFEIEPTPSRRLITALYTNSLRALYLLLAIANTYLLFSPISHTSYFMFGSVDNINMALHILLSILCFITITLVCAWQSHDFLQLVNRLLRIDQQLQTLTSVKARLSNDCAFYRRYLMLLCIFIVLTFQPFDWSENVSTSSVLLLLFYLIENIISNCFIIFIAVLCHLLTMRFRYLNVYAKSFTLAEAEQRQCRDRQLNPTVFYVILPEERQRGAHAENPFISASSFIYRTHYELLKIFKELNEFVGPALMIYFVYIFYVVSAAIYFMAAIAKGKISDMFTVWHVASLYLHISLVALISRCCSTLTREAHQMSAILSNIYGRNEKCRKVTDTFLTTNLKLDIQFTACKLFTIDNSTLFKLSCAVTTYLAILRQFKQLESSKSGK